jgi:branched-chain amino acid transport system substrate-binding protein
MLAHCHTDKTPLKIGFVGGLTGRVSDLGIAGRDGALLAVDEINRQGGIAGREVLLVIKDDEQDPAVAERVDRELLAEGVSAIIGHMTSAMTMVAKPIIDEGQMLMLSPTTSTNELNKLDDYILRVFPSSAQTSKLLADTVYSSMGLRTVSAVYDVRNRAHTESAFGPFREEFSDLGGSVHPPQTFLSGPDVSFIDLARQVVKEKADGLYILANAMDTAMLCQQLKKLDHTTQVISSDWSATKEILLLGGAAVEDLFFVHTIDHFSEEPRYTNFCEAFIKRFGREPGFASCHAYDCAQVIFRALRENKAPDTLKDTLLSIGTFQGLQGQILFDPYGDVEREHYPFTIRNGNFSRK